MQVSAQFGNPEELLQELGIIDPSDLDIEVIAQFCGATIVYERLYGCEARLLGYRDRAIITVHEEASEERKRFSAAHELAHWVKHRGKIALQCEQDDLLSQWGEHQREGTANRYAAELLMPSCLFLPLASDKSVTFHTIRWLAKIFRTSLTATAIRLVQMTSARAILICSSESGRAWFEMSPNLKDQGMWPRRTLPRGTPTASLLLRNEDAAGPLMLSASTWFGGNKALGEQVREETVRITRELALTLIVWAREPYE